MIIFSNPITLQELKEKHSDFYEEMVKIVVDLQENKIAANADLHFDLEQELLEQGSSQSNLWGANIYFDTEPFIEYTSMINIRPAQNNFGMEIRDESLKNEIKTLIEKLIIK